MRARLVAVAGTLLALAWCGMAPRIEGQAAERRAPERRATVGQAASGQVMSEQNGVLRLDTTPCRDVSSVIVFRQPYFKEGAGNVNCKGATRALVQVVQR